MFKYCFLSFTLVVVSRSASVPAPKEGSIMEPVAILHQESDSSPEGSYKWSFEAADGTKAEQTAEVKNLDKDTVVEDIHGLFSYVDPEGKTHLVQYTANEHGYFPKGDDVFPEIASHLAYLEANPQPIEKDIH